MATDREQILAALKRGLEPELTKRKFQGFFPNYRRLTPQKTDLITLHINEREQFFRLEVAELPPRSFMGPNGVWVDLETASTYDATTSNRAKLIPRPGKARAEFKFSGGFFQKSDRRFEEAVEAAVALLPQADAWWRGNRNQPNIWAGG